MLSDMNVEASSFPYTATYALLGPTTSLSSAAHLEATDFGSDFCRVAIVEFTCGSWPLLLVTVGLAPSDFPDRFGPKKSYGCGKSWNQSVNPIWAFVLARPMVEKYTCWSSCLTDASNPIWFSVERRYSPIAGRGALLLVQTVTLLPDRPACCTSCLAFATLGGPFGSPHGHAVSFS